MDHASEDVASVAEDRPADLTVRVLELSPDGPRSVATLPTMHVTVRESEALRSCRERLIQELGRAGSVVLRAEPITWFIRPGASDLGDDANAVHDSVAPSQELYGVDAHGYLLVDDQDLRRLTVGDWRRAGEAGYLDGDWADVLFYEPQDLGGLDWTNDVVAFLQDVGVEVTGGVVLGWLARARRSVTGWWGGLRPGDRGMRALAQRWAEHGIEAPRQIREWIDRRDAWSTEEVGERLGLDDVGATSLLTALGYRQDDRSRKWRRDQSRKGRRARKKWLAAEDRNRRPME